MPIIHASPVPKELPFHADGFGWQSFERFCAAWLVSGTTLPNLTLNGGGPSRLQVIDAHRVGSAGEKQFGIDILVTMENRATWVVQCKRMETFSKLDAERAIKKAEAEFGKHHPAHYLLWVTGDVKADATLLVHEKHPNWSLWSGERLSTEFLLYTPRSQCYRILTQCFSPGWAKAIFPIPDHLLSTREEFYSRWDGENRSFHHHAALVGRDKVLDALVGFASGGKGRKALILSAQGGVGKSRLLAEVADRVEGTVPGRLVRFINPEASSDAEPPRDEQMAKMTVIHDDAHRMDMPGIVLAMLTSKEADGSRLILSTRPGAEDSLQQRLMEAGYQAEDINRQTLPKLTKPSMVDLAGSILGAGNDQTARALADISDGCALITLVGAELLRRGELTHLDLERSDTFRAEVFSRFEGRELERVRCQLATQQLEKLLRSIALLSPWDAREPSVVQQMADFIGVPPGEIHAACDALMTSGLLVTTHKGLRITPDLFSDHLVYVACYDAKGRSTAFIDSFLNHFAEAHSATVLHNLVEAEWRAAKKHDGSSERIVTPIWQRFLKEFEVATFWDRSQMMEKWSAIAIYQPDLSLELASWAMDMTTAPPKAGYAGISTHERVLHRVPGILKPLAIWSNDHRQRALQLLWQLHRDFTIDDFSNRGRFADFAEIASFRHNYPDAPNGVLDWLEKLLAGNDAERVADKPCQLLDTTLRPYFAQIIEQNYWRDRRTFVFGKVPVSVAITKAIRHRALSFITEVVIPRGTVAAMNVLPVLAEAFRQTSAFHDLPPAADRAWRPERMMAFEAISQLAKRYEHPLLHYAIRHQVRWPIVYGKDEGYRAACEQLVQSLPDTFELRLARLTLSWSHDDSLNRYERDRQSGWHEIEKQHWQSLLQDVASTLLSRHKSPNSLQEFLVRWNVQCAEHGLEAKLGELLAELARQNQSLMMGALDIVLANASSPMAGYVGNFIQKDAGASIEDIESRVKQGLASSSVPIVRSFLTTIQFSEWLMTPTIIDALMAAAKLSQGLVLHAFFQLIDFTKKHFWTDRLALTLVKRELSDEDALHLAGAMIGRDRYAEVSVCDEAIDMLLERLILIPILPSSYEDKGVLHALAKRHPRQMFEFFVRRVAREEALEAGGQAGFAAVPFYDSVPLVGLEKEPDFENLARDLISKMLSRPKNQRHPWRQLFKMAVSRTSPLVESLILEGLTKAENADDLIDLCSLTAFEGSVIAFRYPRLIDALLKKARRMGIEVFERARWELIHAATPQSRGYTGGVLDEKYRYALEEAEKSAQAFKDDPLLAPFYQKIIEIEKADADRQRRWAEEEMGDDWG